MRLPENFDEFLHGLSRENRHEFRRHEKKLTDDFAGQMRIHCYRTEEELNDLAQEVDKVSAKTDQRAIGVGFKTDSRLSDLCDLQRTEEDSEVAFSILLNSLVPSSLETSTKTRFTATSWGLIKFGKYSPGLYILMHSIEQCFEPDHRATQIDLGWGDRQYKRPICNQSWKDGPMY